MLLDAHGPGALAHQGDIIRVCPKGGNIPLHPLQCRQLIVEPVVAGTACLLLQFRQAGEAQRPSR